MKSLTPDPLIFVEQFLEREEMKTENPFRREFHFTKWEDLGVF